ncbi:MAG: hypothetical protein H0T17_01850 [Propionibacteriales bacterium]|nr:hypothetical protein [Propionibacteriales bacterium]
MAVRRPLVAVTLAVSALLAPSGTAVGGPVAPTTTRAAPLVDNHRLGRAEPDKLEDTTGLSVTLDALRPAVLTPGKRLKVKGSVTNSGQIQWRNAKVYLDVAYDPATTRAALDEFADTDVRFGSPVLTIGLFDEIGRVRPGTTVDYRLSIPFDELPISGDPGVYHIGISVLAENRVGRDSDADARVETIVALRPDKTEPVQHTRVVTLVPVVAPVIRHPSGTFVDEQLITTLSAGGQLRNLVDVLNRAPPNTLEIVADPALLQAVRDMSDGYSVATMKQDKEGEQGRDGSGQQAANDWLASFDAAAARQDVLLMAWGSPDAAAFANAHMPVVVNSAVTASQTYALERRIIAPIVNWQANGAATRRGLVEARAAGAVISMVSEDNFANLDAVADSQYPPTLVTVPTIQGPLTATMLARSLAGRQLTSDTTTLDLRQELIAEATVRSLSSDASDRVAVVALPFDWNPGPDGGESLAPAYNFRVVRPIDLETANHREPSSYQGPITRTTAQPAIPADLITATAGLRDSGITLTEVLTRKSEAIVDFRQRLAVAGSSLWTSRTNLRIMIVRREARQAAQQLRKVTVTGPTFVALSSDSGSFPLTVTNNLDEAVTVNINVRPANPALQIDPIDQLELDPGETVDLDAVARADSSGVTQVRVRLSTTKDRPFGNPWAFDIRTTQIGLAIWVVMGLGMVVLLVAAAVRIMTRIRTTGLRPRERPSP